MKFNVKIITDPAEVDMDKITKWIYYWWGKNFHFSKGKIKSLLTNSCNDKKLPITCVAFAKLNGGGATPIAPRRSGNLPNCYERFGCEARRLSVPC